MIGGGEQLGGLIHQSSPRKHLTSSRLYGNKQADEISRQGALQTATAAAAFMATSTLPVNADDGGGKLIEFTVNNLDGKEGETGVFVVKTRPEWAPIRGERFEVSSFEMLHVHLFVRHDACISLLVSPSRVLIL